MVLAEAQQVLEGIRAYFLNPRRLEGEDARILATSVTPDGAAIVIFLRREDGPVEGIRVDLDSFSAMFEPRDLDFLARVIATDLIAQPGRGRPLNEDWAVGLVDRPREVLWTVV